MEEDRLQKKLNFEQRDELKKRLAISMFLETNLNFIWHATSGRIGTFSLHNQISDCEILNELNTIRPFVTHTFTPSIQPDTIKICETVKLIINYSGEPIIRCSVNLSDYLNPEHGVAWIGKTTQLSREGSQSFTFLFHFTKSRSFTFPVHYETTNHTTGLSYITFNVIE